MRVVLEHERRMEDVICDIDCLLMPFFPVKELPLEIQEATVSSLCKRVVNELSPLHWTTGRDIITIYML